MWYFQRRFVEAKRRVGCVASIKFSTASGISYNLVAEMSVLQHARPRLRCEKSSLHKELTIWGGRSSSRDRRHTQVPVSVWCSHHLPESEVPSETEQPRPPEHVRGYQGVWVCRTIVTYPLLRYFLFIKWDVLTTSTCLLSSYQQGGTALNQVACRQTQLLWTTRSPIQDFLAVEGWLPE